MDTWEFRGADERGIYVRLYRGDNYTDVVLPPTRDYFENEGQDSEYLSSNFDRLWDANAVLGADEIELTADKTTINADGVDAATITATIPVDAEYCFITVNGPPAEKADVVDGEVVREFSAGEAGLYKVEFFAGNKTAAIIIEVTDNA